MGKTFKARDTQLSGSGLVLRERTFDRSPIILNLTPAFSSNISEPLMMNPEAIAQMTPTVYVEYSLLSLLSYSLAEISCPNSVRGCAQVTADSKME
jgi:hypothetical protein